MRTLLIYLLVSISAMGPVFSAEPDSCVPGYNPVDFGFQLVTATKDARGIFIGTFELENIRFGKEVTLRGEKRQGNLTILEPEIEPQFMDLNGSWVSFLQIPGSHLGRRDIVRIAEGGKAMFVTDIPSTETLPLGGFKLRLLLRLNEPKICIASEPFVVLQRRGPIEGFITEKRSNKALQRTLEDSRR